MSLMKIASFKCIIIAASKKKTFLINLLREE